jgi:transcriptional regulator of arginine metabolism
MKGGDILKYARHTKILELIEKYELETQEEVAFKLKEAGFKVTQATVSRDIKELRLIKILSKDGRYKYAKNNVQEAMITERFMKLFKDAVISIEHSGNMIVIKTLVGSANAAAAAIDAVDTKDVVGTIAGDDTIFLLISEEADIYEVKKIFQDMIG